MTKRKPDAARTPEPRCPQCDDSSRCGHPYHDDEPEAARTPEPRTALEIQGTLKHWRNVLDRCLEEEMNMPAEDTQEDPGRILVLRALMPQIEVLILEMLAELRDAPPASATAETPTGFNPADCNCEYTHCSSSTCRSKEISRGAIPESQRVYPAQATADTPNVWDRRYGEHPSPKAWSEVESVRERLFEDINHELQRRKTMATRCKVVCSMKDEKNKNVHFYPVYSGSEENKQFFASTPGGVMSFNIVNDASFEQFEQGKEYYVDIFKAD